MEFSKAFKFIVKSVEGGKVLLSHDNQELRLPQDDLRGDLQEGDVLFAVFAEEEKETAKVRNMAKEVLNEILHPEDHD